jgi:hypothetical protein
LDSRFSRESKDSFSKTANIQTITKKIKNYVWNSRNIQRKGAVAGTATKGIEDESENPPSRT